MFQVILYSPDKALESLSLIQSFDPVGVAARDVRECLLIQTIFQNLGGTIVEKTILNHMDKLESQPPPPERLCLNKGYLEGMPLKA